MQGSPRIDELRQKFHENPRRYFAPLANEYRKAGDPEQAIAICRAHLAQQPGHMSGHVVYGQALYAADRPVEARAVFEKALSLDPDNAIVLRSLGDIARERGDSSEARHWYSKALDIDPGDTEVAAYIAELAEPITGEATTAETAELTERVPAEESRPAAAEKVEPAAVPEAPADVDEGEDDVSWRKTPRPVESPFVTRTMAELYARQGYHAAALDVYNQLALNHPDDLAIRARIDELKAGAVPVEAVVPPAEPALEAGQSAPAPAEPLSPVGEPEAVSVPVRESDFQEEPLGLVDLSDEPMFPVDAEATELSAKTFGIETGFASDETVAGDAPPVDPAKHFTEVDLSAGDTWDTDAWGAGFAADDEVGSEFETLDVHEPAEADQVASKPEAATPTGEQQVVEEPVAGDTLGAEAEAEADVGLEPEAASASIAAPEPVVETMPEPILETVPEPIAEATPEPAAEPDPEPETEPEPEPEAEPEAEPEPEPDPEPEPEPEAELLSGVEQAEDVGEAVAAAAPFPAADLSPASYEEEDEGPGVVAYSPEPPRDEELAHFTPKQPTVREFFATLGARKPPPAETAQSFTARAAIPGDEIAPADELPLATDAFANLFQEHAVPEEDTRAAFALSGAMSGKAHDPVPPRVQTSPPRPVPAIPDAASAPAQESEEDIRRFREWLDGLSQP
jgi:tetratricopeptide (TPR) repeat protein